MHSSFPSPKENSQFNALNEYANHNLVPDQDYDELTWLTAETCRVPMALISLVDGNRECTRSQYGFRTQEIPSPAPFGAYNPAEPAAAFIVPDVRLDPRFASHPLVTGEPSIVFYAGVPLVDQNGLVLGTLSVMDTTPRSLRPGQQQSLHILAKQVVRLLTMEKQAQHFRDLEERHQREKAVLETNEKWFKTILDHAPIGLGLLRGPDHVFELVNDRIAEMAGRQAAQMQGKPLLEALPELAQQGLKEIFDSVRQTGQRFVAPELPVTLQRNDRLETAYFYASFEPVQEADGSVSIVDFSLEITQQIQNQRELQDSEARLRTIVEQAPMAIGQLKGRDMVVEIGNDKLFEVLGKDRSITGMRLLDALPEIQSQPFIDLLEHVYDTGEPYSGNGILAQLIRNGHLEDAYFDFSYTPIRDADNQISGILILAIEVTKQVLARQTTEQSESRFRRLIAEAPFAIAVYETAELVISVANEAMIRLWGKTPAVIGQRLVDALPELEGQPFISLLNNVYSTGQTYRTTEQQANLVVDGRLQSFWFNFVYQPLTDANGQVYAILNMAVDLTDRVLDRKRVEESENQYRNLARHLESRVEERTQALTQANQDLLRSNESLQQFAYVASHDLQEPLRKIQSFSSLLVDQYKAKLDTSTVDYLDRITSAATRMSLLIKDLLIFSRVATQQQSFEPVSLDTVISNGLDMLSLEMEQRNVRLDRVPLPVVQGDESQLNQLFQNLLSNAIKFTPADRQPHVQIGYALRQSHELPADVHPGSAAGAYHEISIRDQGVGFDEKFLSRIFQVFQRLHAKNEFPGTGIGLAICERVVTNHGGAITASSKPDEGATFYVYLPVGPA